MDFGTLIVASLLFAVTLIGAVYAMCIGHVNSVFYGMFAAGSFCLLRYVWIEGTEEVNGFSAERKEGKA